MSLPRLKENFIQRKAMDVLNREIDGNSNLTRFEISAKYVVKIFLGLAGILRACG